MTDLGPKSWKNLVFCHKSGRICHFWRSLPHFPDEAEICKFCRNLSDLTPTRAQIWVVHFWPEWAQSSMRVGKMWQMFQKSSLHMSITKTCQKWQMLVQNIEKSKKYVSVKFGRFWDQNVSNLTDSASFSPRALKSVIFCRNLPVSPPPTRAQIGVGHFWQNPLSHRHNRKTTHLTFGIPP